MSLPVGYEYRDVTACGLRIQRRHCLWVTNTETYRDVTACGLRIQRCHCLWVTNTETTLPVGYEYRDVTACAFCTQTSLPVSFCLTLLFETDEKDALLENDLREIIALISSEC